MRLAVVILGLWLSLASCNRDGEVVEIGRKDLTPHFAFPDEGDPGDLTMTDDWCLNWDECGNGSCGFCCRSESWGPPPSTFSLRRDPRPYPWEGDENLGRDASGYLELKGAASGRYSMMFDEHCASFNAFNPRDTEWDRLRWEADVPAGTSLVVHARSGDNMDPATWGANAWTRDTTTSPIDLRATLRPNLLSASDLMAVNDRVLLVEFLFQTNDPKVTPRLKSFVLGYTCPCYSGL